MLPSLLRLKPGCGSFLLRADGHFSPFWTLYTRTSSLQIPLWLLIVVVNFPDLKAGGSRSTRVKSLRFCQAQRKRGKKKLKKNALMVRPKICWSGANGYVFRGRFVGVPTCEWDSKGTEWEKY